MNDPDFIIDLATDGAAIARCHPVATELRPHLSVLETFVEQVQRQQEHGYQLAYLESGAQVRSIAGFRILEKLSAGRFLYVDDLVTRAPDSSRGYGGTLLDWLVDRAREAGCTQIQLDSGVWRYGAHRFISGKEWRSPAIISISSSMHFVQSLPAAAERSTEEAMITFEISHFKTTLGER